MKMLKRTSAFFLAIATTLCMSACDNSSGNVSSNRNNISVNSSSSTKSTLGSSESSPVKTENSASTIENSSSETENTENPEVKKAVFDFENKRVLLNSGYYMPIVGLGTYALSDDV